MNEMLPALDYLQRRLEPDPAQVALDETMAEPFEWTPNTLYTYLLPSTDYDPFETGPAVIRRFVVRVVYVASDEGEGADRRRTREISDLLDHKRATYVDRIRGSQSAPPFWDYISVSEVPPPDTLTTRAVSLQLAGYRILN